MTEVEGKPKLDQDADWKGMPKVEPGVVTGWTTFPPLSPAAGEDSRGPISGADQSKSSRPSTAPTQAPTGGD